MATRKRLLAHFPEKYAEIAHTVGLGQAASIPTTDTKEAQSIYFEFNTWRAVLRREVPTRPDLADLLTLAEAVIASYKHGECVVYFRHRELSRRAKALEAVKFFSTIEEAEANDAHGKKQ